MAENVILVDEEDNEIGVMEKLEAHKKGKLHRAFSIVVFNTKGEMLIQQRAEEKYHCGGIWANSCCSHPRHSEVIDEAVHRRLQEEMGFDCELKEMFKFTYYSKFDNGLIEYETDHVFFGISDAEVVMNRDEAMDYKWISMPELVKDIAENPDKYAPWFKIVVEELISDKVKCAENQ
jgi:isopentenyl-diphosphate delta-isomerase